MFLRVLVDNERNNPFPDSRVLAAYSFIPTHDVLDRPAGSSSFRARTIADLQTGRVIDRARSLATTVTLF